MSALDTLRQRATEHGDALVAYEAARAQCKRHRDPQRDEYYTAQAEALRARLAYHAAVAALDDAVRAHLEAT